MTEILKLLKKRNQENWLLVDRGEQLYFLTQNFCKKIKANQLKRIIINESNYLIFLAKFLAGVAANCSIFLCNYNWGYQEWLEVEKIVNSKILLSANIVGKIMIPTGGTSGKIRFAIHTWETLRASVQGFSQYFALQTINSFCVLPLYHVSGLMQFMRSFLSGGKIIILPYKILKTGEIFKINPQAFYLSLVPTQLQYLLTYNPLWLSQFKTILLGGGPAWPSLLDTARKYNIRLAPTYGMTETASQIVTLKPEDFLKGNHSSGQVLPQAQVKIIDETGHKLGVNQTGIITIRSKSLYLGYYPNVLDKQDKFITDDLGFLDNQGYLNIIGRNSQKIITGGENVFPTEIEAVILATNLVKEVCVLGLPDSQWGEVVTAVYVPLKTNVSSQEISSKISDKISKFKQPKYWLEVENIPRNQQGKIEQKKIKDFALEQLNSSRP